MVKKTVTDLGIEEYHQSIPLVVIVVAIASAVASYVCYSTYSTNHSVANLVLANMFLVIAIMFVKPIIEWRRITIDNDVLTIYKLFFKPIKINISESLYQVVIKNDDIRSYRFRVGKCYTQISPTLYKNGVGLSKRLKDHIAKNRLVVEAVD
jgi:hypothetical protein